MARGAIVPRRIQIAILHGQRRKLEISHELARSQQEGPEEGAGRRGHVRDLHLLWKRLPTIVRSEDPLLFGNGYRPRAGRVVEPELEGRLIDRPVRDRKSVV